MSEKSKLSKDAIAFKETIESYDWKTLKTYASDMGISVHSKKREAILSELMAHYQNNELAPVQVEDEVELTSYQRLSRLIRCRVINQNPNETKLPTKLFTVGNMIDDFIPSRVVTFGAITHLPASLIDHLKNVTYRYSITKRNAKGHKYTENKELPHYDIQILPPLTPKQLKELAREQKATNRLID